MEHLKNIGMGALAIAITVLMLAIIVLAGMLALNVLDILVLYNPDSGPVMFWTAITLAIMWAIGRTIRRQAT